MKLYKDGILIAEAEYLTHSALYESGTIILVQLGINNSRISAIGMGESFPIMTNEEIEKLKTDNEKYVAYRKNERVEIIILSE